MAIIDFGGVKEDVVTAKEFSLAKARKILEKETIAVLGYGVQGQTQALNLRDNSFHVIVGQRFPSDSWDKALRDGWKKGENLFSLEEAAGQSTIIIYLLSDAGQIAQWKKIKKHLTSARTLCFSHGFAVVYKDFAKISFPKDIDIILIAPHDLGASMREKFLKKHFSHCSFSIYQNATGKARKTVLALGVAIGAGILMETTFEKEVYSDLTSERGILIGALSGMMEAQYQELRRRGHSPREAFYVTIEELTQNIVKLVGENGMDWLLENCSATAQRGALDWRGKFKKALTPVFKELYKRVKDGTEAKIVLGTNSNRNYKKILKEELAGIKKSEMWKVGAKVRELRLEKWKKIVT